jgi:hypothetical protein
MPNEIEWYGERGIVNALVTDFVGRGEAEAVAGVRSLLEGVQWAGGATPAWVRGVSAVTFFVEPGMGQFGNPDLILVCSTDVGAPPYIVIVEAKVVPYLESAMSNTDSMSEQGYNSSINGQLTLRYRLAQALCGW